MYILYFIFYAFPKHTHTLDYISQKNKNSRLSGGGGGELGTLELVLPLIAQVRSIGSCLELSTLFVYWLSFPRLQLRDSTLLCSTLLCSALLCSTRRILYESFCMKISV